MKSGIYKIINKVNGKFYVGSSIDFTSRFKNHRSQLNKNAHHSIALQRAWNKYGEDSFIFQIIETVDKATNENIKSLEQKYLNEDYGDYNCCRCANGGSITPLTSEKVERILIDYSKGSFTHKDISKIHDIHEAVSKRICSGDTYKFYDIDKRLIEKCKIVSKRNVKNGLSHGSLSNRTLTDDDAATIKWLIEDTFVQDIVIAEHYNFHRKVINQIKNGQSYGHVDRRIKDQKLRDDLIIRNPYKCVRQLDMDGNFLRLYENAASASISVRGDKRGRGGILDCCKGNQGYAYGSKWEFLS